MSNQYYKRAAGAIIVFDLANHESFESCIEWYNKLRECGEKTCEAILIGNKSDLVEHRKVTFKEAQDFANKNSLPYIETSVLNNKNVSEAFKLLLNKVIGALKIIELNSKSSFSQNFASPRRSRYNSSIFLKHSSEFMKDKNLGNPDG